MKIKARSSRRFLTVIAFLLVPLGAGALSPAVEEGLTLFQRSRFDQAILRFREAILEAADSDSEATAYFWLAKSALALNRLDEAGRNFEYYLNTFPNHAYTVEARYQRGRILFLQEDYEAAIQVFAAFERSDPRSAFVANAVYWAGESLFALGRLEDARGMFERVQREFPESFRVEAARYRISVIDLNFRERELLRLLQWSHEEHIRTVDEFQRRELAYQQAIADYQRRIRDGGTQESRDEILRLSNQVRTLQETIRGRDAEIARLRQQLQQAQPTGRQ